MPGAAVPEAAIHEYRDLDTWEQDVGASSKAGQRGDVDPVAQAQPVQCPAQHQLRGGVAASGSEHPDVQW
jgi:hypothetical protein